eukprot:CAMPEP_0170407356 /NCGR_PEP_ID=MMETSP0117_2-20130122/28204_1 /TAXON_ID=400756 /ORGANISM="Durinskia baltica, Strain CSIRO CS-38" /LENGTH=163 /DNA_ID=CAMNT_0010664599 /DNA_START=42 /DNA_END=533 /DNA_ORIENTATION=+
MMRPVTRRLLGSVRAASGSPKHVTLTENFVAGNPTFRNCTVVSGKHKITSDIPVAGGGEDKGMSPKEILMSALASCTAMTIRTVFEGSKLKAPNAWDGADLSGISITVAEHGDHPHVPSKLTVDINLSGALTEEQKKRLLRAADACPVKKIITGQTPVESAIV